MDLDGAIGELDVDTGFGGLYWKRAFGAFNINAAILGGFTDNEQTRNVGGLNAEGDFDGRFIAPSVTVSLPLNAFDQAFILSGRASYVNLSLDGFTETGAAPGLLTVDDRDVGIFNFRGLFNVPTSKTHDNGSRTDVNVGFGIDATVDAGSDDVSAIALGGAFDFSAETVDEVTALINFNVGHTFAGGRARIGASGEFQSDFDDTFQANGQLRASYKF